MVQTKTSHLGKVRYAIILLGWRYTSYSMYIFCNILKSFRWLKSLFPDSSIIFLCSMLRSLKIQNFSLFLFYVSELCTMMCIAMPHYYVESIIKSDNKQLAVLPKWRKSLQQCFRISYFLPFCHQITKWPKYNIFGRASNLQKKSGNSTLSIILLWHQ